MAASNLLSPLGMTFLAMCGGSSAPDIDDTPTSTGFSCWEYQRMIEIELDYARVCSLDVQCDQVIPVEDSCPTAAPVVNIEFDSVWLIEMIEEAEGEGCSLDLGPRGTCDPDSEPVCFFTKCTWQ